MLEPGTHISHAAVKLAAITGTLLIWVVEAGVRLYSSGQPGGARSDKLLYQAKLVFEKEGDVVSLLFYFVVIYFVRFCFFLCVFCNQFDLTGP